MCTAIMFARLRRTTRSRYEKAEREERHFASGLERDDCYEDITYNGSEYRPIGELAIAIEAGGSDAYRRKVQRLLAQPRGRLDPGRPS